jgi:hypothetical protein
MRGKGPGGNCGVSANEYSLYTGVHINFGDLTPYLTINNFDKKRIKSVPSGKKYWKF